VRTVWDTNTEEWYFSVVDVVAVLTDSIDHQTARKYWNKLKQRLKEEGNETVTNCHQFKMRAADGKMRLTDVADTEQVLRLIQSIPSPKAEPFKQWSGFRVKEYKQYKGLHKENLRDNMTNLELALNMLAETATTELSKQENPRNFRESAKVAQKVVA
jgi:hypothetical protein